jgi:hypothetical protein
MLPAAGRGQGAVLLAAAIVGTIPQAIPITRTQLISLLIIPPIRRNARLSRQSVSDGTTTASETWGLPEHRQQKQPRNERGGDHWPRLVNAATGGRHKSVLNAPRRRGFQSGCRTAPRLWCDIPPPAVRCGAEETLTADVTTDLSRIADSLVIACNTAFTYREGQARYIVERARSGRSPDILNHGRRK